MKFLSSCKKFDDDASLSQFRIDMIFVYEIEI